jgi:alpha-L-fucosidase 2
MKRLFPIIAMAFMVSCQQTEKNNQLILWYDSPANKWEEALPIGNGRIGGMVYGGVTREQIQFNEETLWTGEPHEYQNPGSYEYLDTIRKLLFEGKQQEAEKLAMDNFMSQPLRQKAYQPFGDLIIEMKDLGEISKYQRELDLNDGIARVQFSSNGYQYHRESWVSFPDQVMAIKLTVNEKKKLNFDLGLNSIHKSSRVIKTDNGLRLLVEVDNGVLKGEAIAWVQECDGFLEIMDGHIEIREASSVLVLLTAATTFRDFRNTDANPEQVCQDIISNVQEYNYKKLRKNHLKDYQSVFGGFEIDFGTGKENLPTDQRIVSFWKDPNDPSLLSLYAQYGRYLMISSSRNSGQPANLQGIWNPHIKPPWESKWTVNINTEMNYWPAELTGLQACTEPLFRMIEECVETGAKVAKEHYQARGWVLHHNTDIWRGAAPINASNHGIWVTGGAWLTTHMWEHYLFTKDETFLRDRAWPVMKGAAQFFLDYMVPDPDSGWMISGPSNSPENGGLVMGPTMDHQIIRTLFKACVEAANILNTDAELRDSIQAFIPRIAPNQIGQYGQLQEWLEDKDDPNNKHRHVSHLWGVYPGNDITWDDPDLMNAAKQSLIMRGDEGTGWSLAWKINFWSRFHNGNHAYELVQMLLSPAEHPERSIRGGTYPNLFDAHPPFQIDGNFGATAGIVEMLIQSHTGEIHLLPALPDALPNGSIEGVHARGGFILSFSWDEKELSEVEVRSNAGGTCFLRYKNQTVEFFTEPGTKHFFDKNLIQQ